MVKQGKIIVLDGLDGCGKSTQFAALGKLLTEQGETVKPISFPMYDKPSAALVKMYLRGDFSDTPDGVNAYAASSFYAVDRYANYKLDWEKNYTAGELILAMDWENLTELQQRSPACYHHKIQLLMRYANDYDAAVVPDPYYGINEGFNLVIEYCTDACHGLLETLEKKAKQLQRQRGL